MAHSSMRRVVRIRRRFHHHSRSSRIEDVVDVTVERCLDDRELPCDDLVEVCLERVCLEKRESGEVISSIASPLPFSPVRIRCLASSERSSGGCG